MSTEPVHTIEFNDGHTLLIIHDTDPESPRDWDNLGIMVCFHKRYRLGDDHGFNPDSFNGWDDFKRHLESEHDAVVILPLYLYDHSGITMNTGGFSCSWDSGQVGFIYLPKDNLIEEYGADTPEFRERARQCLQEEVKLYDQYLTGDTYGYVLLGPGPEPCESCGHTADRDGVDSCCGFYGDNPVTNGMVEHFDRDHQKELNRLFGS